MKLSQDDFKPVTLADRSFFEKHYALYPQTHSDNTFTNMVSWNHFAHYRYAYINGNVILASTIDDVTRFRPPIGPRDPELMRAVLAIASDMGGEIPLVLIDPETVQWLTSIDSSLNIVPDRNHFEYVYRTSDLAELPGKNYLKIRSQINKFRKNCRHTVEEITPQNRAEVMEFLVKWCEWKGCQNDVVLAHEKEAVFYAIEHFTELPVRGLLIRVNGEVGAMALFERLNRDTALVHFEKGLPDCEGIYKAINNETALSLVNEVEFINRESDLGVAGLREAKMRYHPDHMVEVYRLEQ